MVHQSQASRGRRAEALRDFCGGEQIWFMAGNAWNGWWAAYPAATRDVRTR